jgi:hypothetical protein
MSAPDRARPQDATASPEAGVARIAQPNRRGPADVKQKLARSLQAGPAAGCAAPATGISSLVIELTSVLAPTSWAQAQGGAAS